MNSAALPLSMAILAFITLPNNYSKLEKKGKYFGAVNPTLLPKQRSTIYLFVIKCPRTVLCRFFIQKQNKGNSFALPGVFVFHNSNSENIQPHY